jgi:RNA polymerase sigma-70 factor (ECF subfamily)
MDHKRSRFETEVLAHLDAAYRFARWLSRSPDDAEDLVQEAILRAFRAFGSLRSSDPKPWLLAIVKNCHVTASRQQRRHAFVPLPSDDAAPTEQALISTLPDPEHASLQRDAERSFERLLAALSEEHREVLVLREVEEMDYRAIAAVTNLPIGTVMSRLARARAALKVCWLKDHEAKPHAMP